MITGNFMHSRTFEWHVVLYHIADMAFWVLQVPITKSTNNPSSIRY